MVKERRKGVVIVDIFPIATPDKFFVLQEAVARNALWDLTEIRMPSYLNDIWYMKRWLVVG